MKRSPEVFREEIIGVVGREFLEKPPALFEFIRNHLTPEGARIFAMEHCVFADKFPHWFGNIVGNCPVLEVRQYMIGNMFIEEVKDPTIEQGHYESMVDFAVALGVSRDEVVNYKGRIHTRMAVAYWDNISRTGPWLDAFAAIGGLEMVNSEEIAERFGLAPINKRELWAPLGLSGRAMAHWEAGEAADTHEGGHGDMTTRILTKYAETEEKQDSVLEAMSESLQVMAYQMNLIGQAAIEASGQAAARR